LYDADIPPEIPRVIVRDEDIEKQLRKFSEDPMPGALFDFTDILFWATPDRLRTVIEKAVPVFFEKYPSGRLHFVRIHNRLHVMQSVSRVLTAIDAFGFEIYEDPEIAKQRPSELLSKIHPVTYEPIGESIIKTLLSCFFRYVYGRCVPRINGMIIVQIDPPAEFTLPYRRDRWDFNRLSGIFETDSLGLEEYLQRKNKVLNADEERIAYKRYVFRPAWSAQQFEDLLKWTIARVDKLLTFACDLCNYTNGAGFIDFIKRTKVFLSLERIIAEINYIVTDIDPFVRKTLYFNLHDKIATLPDPEISMVKRRAIYNRLLKTTHYNRVLRKRLSTLPSPFDSKIALLGDELFKNLIEGCLDSIWAQYRVSEKGVRTRETTSANKYITQKMRERSEGPYVLEDFAANLLHELRNSLHGYQLQGGKFEEFLLMHLGQIPDSLPDLTVIWYFLLLADTPGLLSGDWTRGTNPRGLVASNS
jgi:hypothetical protein